MFTQTAALMLAAVALPASAQTAADAPAKAKPEHKSCRTYDTTGSIMGGTKVCHTKAEWSAIDQANGDNAARQRDMNGQGANRQGGGF